MNGNTSSFLAANVIVPIPPNNHTNDPIDKKVSNNSGLINSIKNFLLSYAVSTFLSYSMHPFKTCLAAAALSHDIFQGILRVVSHTVDIVDPSMASHDAVCFPPSASFPHSTDASGGRNIRMDGYANTYTTVFNPCDSVLIIPVQYNMFRNFPDFLLHSFSFLKALSSFTGKICEIGTRKRKYLCYGNEKTRPGMTTDGILDLVGGYNTKRPHTRPLLKSFLH